MFTYHNVLSCVSLASIAPFCHQTLLSSVPYNPILHDLSLSPRNMTAGQISQYWLDMYETKDVMEWYDHMEVIDMPSLQLSFAGMFGHIMLLEWGYNQTVTIATPFLGKYQQRFELFHREMKAH